MHSYTSPPPPAILAAIKQISSELNSNLHNWIDITNDCTWFININNTGIHRTFLKINTITKQCIGTIGTVDTINNQSAIVQLPENITNNFNGMCGIAVYHNAAYDFFVNARVLGNKIYSSHSISTPIIQAVYAINFILD